MEHLSKEAFLEIVKRYREGTATQEEANFLDSYYTAFEAEPDVLPRMSETEQNLIRDEVKEAMNLRLAFRERMAGKSRTRRIFLKWGVAAAAAAAVVIAGLFFLKDPSENPPAVASVKVPEQTGVNNLIQLPDGSTVILGADSKIDYPSSFEGGKRRVVYLTGEGYFDVKHNPSKPFVVYTGKLQTRVLGTAFKIRAVPGELSISVTVTRGKVQVGNGKKTFSILKAREQLVYDVASEAAVQETVSTDEVVAWTERDLYFDDVTVLTAVQLLEDRFEVSISIEDERLASQRFTTTFGGKESLESILSSITAFTGATYEVSSNKKHIKLFQK